MKCSGCSRQAAPGKKRCLQCLESIRKAAASYRSRNFDVVRQREIERVAALKESGLCKCGQPLLDGKSRCERCLARNRMGTHKLRSSRKSLGLCACGLPKPTGAKLCASCLHKARERSKRLRDEVIGAYGSSCSCCGETEQRFLQVDHINDDGAEDRKLGLITSQLYRTLKKKGFPKAGYRLLCANCNLGRHLNGGVCPHKK